jgi:hypothetical protein
MLLILTACTLPAAEVPTATVVQTFIPSATMVLTSTYTPESTPTLERKIKVSPKFPDFDLVIQNPESYSQVTLENFINGDILEAEEEYIRQNPPFNENLVNTVDRLNTITRPNKSTMHQYSFDTTNLVIPSSSEHSSIPETRPIEVISYYRFVDFDIFKKLGYQEIKMRENYQTEEQYHQYEALNTRFYVISWAYHNPDGSISIGHSFIPINKYLTRYERSKIEHPGDDPKFIIGYKLENIVYSPDQDINILTPELFLEKIYEIYPFLIPDVKNVEEWANTGQFPKELENVLFTHGGITSIW